MILAYTVLLGAYFAGYIQCFTTPAVTANDLLDRTIEALGGQNALEKLEGVTYHTPSIYRSRSLMQSYNLDRADTAIAVSGRQDVSFKYTNTDDQLQQRIDRHFKPSDYWNWGSPHLDNFNFSLVVRGGGEDGFACYVKGNDQIWLPTELTTGYTDSALASYLVSEGEKLSPKLPLKMKSSSDLTASKISINGIEMDAVFSPELNLTLMLQPKSSLPYIIRSNEMHPVYGLSTNDLYLTNYQALAKKQSGLLFPGYVRRIYNSSAVPLNAVLEDFEIEAVTVDPTFQADYFDGLPANKSFTPKAPPQRVPGISQARVSEFSSNMLWTGLYNSTVNSFISYTVAKDLSTVHWLVVNGGFLGVKQMILEFENEVIVGDAPPQWTPTVIKWIKQKIGKPVTHVFPTHHHRDHTGGVRDYVAIGAKVIAPDIATDYWSLIPNAELITFNSTHPFVYSPPGSNLQAWFRTKEQAVHAADWAYAFVTTKCPHANSSSIVFEADAWHPKVGIENNDQDLMRQWLDWLVKDGVSKDTIVYPTHGQIGTVMELVHEAGFVYPDLKVDDWMGGGVQC